MSVIKTKQTNKAILTSLRLSGCMEGEGVRERNCRFSAVLGSHVKPREASGVGFLKLNKTFKEIVQCKTRRLLLVVPKCGVYHSNMILICTAWHKTLDKRHTKMCSELSLLPRGSKVFPQSRHDISEGKVVRPLQVLRPIFGCSIWRQ